jgi:hypothetical protein
MAKKKHDIARTLRRLTAGLISPDLVKDGSTLQFELKSLDEDTHAISQSLGALEIYAERVAIAFEKLNNILGEIAEHMEDIKVSIDNK